MKKNKKAETFVSIIVGLLIFSIIAIAIIDVTYFNKEITDSYEILTIENILKNNTDVILKKVNLTSINQDEKFYLYKNKTTKNFEVQTGTTNSGSMYIDINGDKVTNPRTSESLVYTRDITLKQDLVKYIKTPLSINNLVLHLDGQDPNGNGTQPGDNSVVNTWTDKSGKGNNGGGAGAPRFKLNTINGFASISLDGASDRYSITNSTDLNTNGTGYTQKSIAIVFKTGNSTFPTTQVLYEQGDNTSGYAISIDSGNIVANIWGGTGPFTRILGKAYQNTTYYMIVVQDSRYTSAYNSFGVYSNGKLMSSISGLNPQTSSAGSISIGRVDTSSYNPLLSTGNYFLGNIGEIIIWNKALSKNEIEGVNNYLNSKWNNTFINNTQSKVNSLIKNVKVYIPK